jgi:hypothetical protein
MDHGDQGALVSDRIVKEGHPLREARRGQYLSVNMSLRP